MDDLDTLKKNPAVIRLFTQRLKLERFGKGLRGCCPFHSDSTPSFDVYQHEGTYLYNCLGCGCSGNVFQFISKFDSIPMASSIKLVKDYLNTTPEHQAEIVDAVFKPISSDKPKVVLTLQDILKYEKALEKNQVAKDWLAKERGINYETARRLHTGYVQDIGRLIGKSDEDVQNKGWIVLPVIDGDKVVSIKYRSIVRKVFRRQPGMATEVFYNMDAIEMLSVIFLTEGEMDTLVLEQAGFRAISLPNATTRTTPEMQDRLHVAEHVILAGDCDNAAGTEKMKKLWAELGDRASLLEWPAGRKDANETFLMECQGDINKFREMVQSLMSAAKSVVMPGIYSLAESMAAHHQTDLANHPERLRFPWTNVDNMAIILPGDVIALLATSTKQGKTAWVMQVSLYGARQHNEVVLNYQCELSLDRFNTIVASHILRRDRNHLTSKDIEEASKRLVGVKYYIGSNPNLTTVGPVLDLIEAAIKRLGATVVVLDHIHFICRNATDEVKAQADASQRISNLAKRYRVKFIMVEQPRKATQGNKGKALHISDGKGSEALHSDAAAVFAIHRDTVKVVDPPPDDPYSPLTTIHLLGGARSKGDGASQAQLMFLGKYATFAEIERTEDLQKDTNPGIFD